MSQARGTIENMTLEQTILGLEDEMWRANREGDGGFYARCLTDDAIVVSRFGVMGKDQIVAGINANRNPFVRSEIHEPRVFALGDSAALITYRATYTALIDGAEQDFTSLSTSVYVLVDGQWRSKFHQQTPL
jgi:uncharacterized protein (TIGR02246 family)